MTHLFISPIGEYPRHQGDILLEYPEFDGVNLPDGWIAVEETEKPSAGENEIVYESDPQIINGVHKQSWSIRPMTEEEIEKRNNMPQTWEEVKKYLGLI